MHRSAFLALPIVLAAAPVLAQTADARLISEAERAFAVDAKETGIGASFNKWAAPDAVVIGAGAIQPIKDAYPPNAPRQAGEPILQWWPSFTGIARSGDFGFATGPVTFDGERRGHYLTVWRRQANGDWRWIFDMGASASAADVAGSDSEPVVLRVADAGAGSQHDAMAEVAAAEAALAAAAKNGQAAAHLAVLAEHGRLYVGSRPPAIGREAFSDALSGWPEALDFSPAIGGGASDAGDMALTYGEVAWIRDGQSRRGHYARMWQRQPEGWRIVLAQLLPAPNPRPAPAPPPAGG